MISRCYRTSSINYSKYGSRGIGVCDKWRLFQNFHQWAMLNGWKENSGLSIDRIDNEQGYSPSNCRFADKYQQAANRRTPPNSSGFVGVEKHNWGWRAYCKIDGKKKHLGVFATAQAAGDVAAAERKKREASPA